MVVTKELLYGLVSGNKPFREPEPMRSAPSKTDNDIADYLAAKLDGPLRFKVFLRRRKRGQHGRKTGQADGKQYCLVDLIALRAGLLSL